MICDTHRIVKPCIRCGLRGATVARLTPDQKVACSNHVGVNEFFLTVPEYVCIYVIYDIYVIGRLVRIQNSTQAMAEAY